MLKEQLEKELAEILERKREVIASEKAIKKQLLSLRNSREREAKKELKHIWERYFSKDSFKNCLIFFSLEGSLEESSSFKEKYSDNWEKTYRKFQEDIAKNFTKYLTINEKLVLKWTYSKGEQNKLLIKLIPYRISKDYQGRIQNSKIDPDGMRKEELILLYKFIPSLKEHQSLVTFTITDRSKSIDSYLIQLEKTMEDKINPLELHYILGGKDDFQQAADELAEMIEADKKPNPYMFISKEKSDKMIKELADRYELEKKIRF